MRSKKKLKLLDNYLEINKILFKCKKMLTTDNINLTRLNIVCKRAIELRNDYLNKIKSCGMYDDSFLIFKKEIDTTINSNVYPYEVNNKSLDLLILQINDLQKQLI